MSEAETAFRSYYAEVVRYFTRRLRDRIEAEDLAQDVFVAAVAGLGDGGAELPVLAWLYLVASRRLVDYRRRERRAAEERSAAEEPVSADDPYTEHALAPALCNAVARLPWNERRVVLMHLFEELSFAEIADLLDLTEAGARKCFQRGREALCVELGRLGIGY